jgi:DNA-binding transcriptional ArsR family regulator
VPTESWRAIVAVMTKDFTGIGRALSAQARSDILNLLMDGSERPATELASGAGISPSTASGHLAVLLDVGLVDCRAAGRSRLYRLADGAVAGALEDLGHLCPDGRDVSFRLSRDARAVAEARFCYDHLAGRLGVSLADAMLRRGWLLGAELDLTPRGQAALAGIGVELSPSARRVTRRCMDWTERRPHLAGATGAAVGALFLERDWVRRVPGGRGLTITTAGRRALAELWGVEGEPAAA